MSLGVRQGFCKTEPWKITFVFFALRKGIKSVAKLKNLNPDGLGHSLGPAFLVFMPAR